MKKYSTIALMLICINCYSQPKINVRHNPRSLTEGITLMDGGEISKDWPPCKLVEVRKTFRGYKHIFVSDTSGILIRYFNVALMTNLCYKVQNKIY